MIPFRDENPTRTFPFVVVALIAANVAVYIHQAMLPPGADALFVYTYGAVPAIVLGKVSLAQVVPAEIRSLGGTAGISASQLQPIWLTIFTSMFLHGGFMHIAGNMLYLWVFGNNVEDALGHLRFIVFYFLCGGLAAAAQIAMSASSPVPMVGASGAIAGVLGAYYMKFPRARVQCLILLFFVSVVMLPAGLVLLLWFLLQVLQSFQVTAGGAHGGVAVFAHIAGFIAGWALVRRFEPKRRRLWV
jgi:membrane associated rhomboid family serine protease